MLTGCGLDDVQKAGVTYINNLYSKGNEPSAEERVEKVFSFYSKGIEEKWKREGEEHEGNKDEIIKLIKMNMTSGIGKPYYIGDAPKEIQSETRRSLIIRLPKGTASSDLFSNKNSDIYWIITLQKEGDDWKIINYVAADDTDVIGEIDWLEVEPTDYL